MNDRLKDLKRGAARPEQISLEIDSGGGGAGDHLMGEEGGAHHHHQFMQEFFATVEEVKQSILAIRLSTKRVGEINQQVVLATTSEREGELSKELTPLVNETNKKAAISKQLLQK
jgi:hypothetical protein